MYECKLYSNRTHISVNVCHWNTFKTRARISVNAALLRAPYWDWDGLQVQMSMIKVYAAYEIRSVDLMKRKHDAFVYLIMLKFWSFLC